MTGLIVDLFAGGGGASLGIEHALGRSPDIAVNHSPLAIACHARNHPKTKHLTANVWEVDPVEATGGRAVVKIDGVEHAITDIFLRMLQPEELKRAQGFDDSYVIEGTKRDCVRLIGNSVCPPVAAAVVRANMQSAKLRETVAS